MLNITGTLPSRLRIDGSVREFFLYIVSGCIALSSDLSVLFLCTEVAGVHYLISNLVGYSVGLLVAYELNIHLVFRYRRYQSAAVELPIFVAIALAGILISELLMYLMVEKISLNYLWAKIVSTGAIFVFNFAARKRFLFSRRPG